MNMLKEQVQNLYRNKGKGVSFFLTAGYPSLTEFKNIVEYIDQKDLADFIEIGVPFSDPVADGPVIQRSSEKAIEAGATFENIIKALNGLKDRIDIPLVLMSYLNVLLAAGLKESVQKAARAGINAFIVPDMPYGEHSELYDILKGEGLDMVLLVSPSTPDERIRKISSVSSPFIYYVSSYGVTGSGKKFNKGTLKRIDRVKKISNKPVYCGFGITDPEDADFVVRSADGIIIGSALIDKIDEEYNDKTFKDILKFAINIKKSINR